MSHKIKERLIKEVEKLLNKNFPIDKKPIADLIDFIIKHDKEIGEYIDEKYAKFIQGASKGFPKSISLSATWWRAIKRIYDNYPLSVRGSLNGSGRFHETGERTIYLAENSTTANLEVQLDKTLATCSLWSIDFKLSGLIDLTDSKTISSLNLDTDWLYGEWEIPNMYKITSYSQKISSYLRGLGHEGFIYDSTKDKGKKCVVIFVDNLKMGSFLEIHDKDQNIDPKHMRIEGKL